MLRIAAFRVPPVVPGPIDYTSMLRSSVTHMHAIEIFMRWWNYLAEGNGKLKFRTQREAAEFVRRVQNESGGPNAKIIAMRDRYNEVNRAKAGGSTSRFDEGRNTAVLG